MYTDAEMAFMECDTNEDGLLDAGELDAKYTARQCEAGQPCPTDNIGQYLLCVYNDNEPLNSDVAEMLYWDSNAVPSYIDWGNCECLPADTEACQPDPEQWEVDFDSCDVSMYDGTTKVAGQDDSLCPEEIQNCFGALCGEYLCTDAATCNCD